MSILNNKVAVVTGAGSGIGRALAVELARRGARLALSDINERAVRETSALCGDAQVRTYKLDVSDRAAFFAHAEEVMRDFGTAHIVINNAGATVVGTIDHLTIEEIDWQLRINLWGVIHGTKAFLPAMLAQRQGWIVNISSVFGLVGYPAQGAYNMSKFAVRGLTECLWSELEGTEVKAICVHPGGIRTNIEKAGRRSVNADQAEAGFSDLSDRMLHTSPEVVARDVLNGVESGKRRIITGKYSSTLYWLSRLIPNSYPRILKMLG
ncbi:putative oxidoreductase SadH [Paraburkholderia sacchari]|uniref:SDR family NAD(P)-dependent oxidoreductase n=1 Tax=Paraburkholderia sacchari TaxID=159450 RepID=UPI0039A5C740